MHTRATREKIPVDSFSNNILFNRGERIVSSTNFDPRISVDQQVLQLVSPILFRPVISVGKYEPSEYQRSHYYYPVVALQRLQGEHGKPFINQTEDIYASVMGKLYSPEMLRTMDHQSKIYLLYDAAYVKLLRNGKFPTLDDTVLDNLRLWDQRSAGYPALQLFFLRVLFPQHSTQDLATKYYSEFPNPIEICIAELHSRMQRDNIEATAMMRLLFPEEWETQEKNNVHWDTIYNELEKQRTDFDYKDYLRTAFYASIIAAEKAYIAEDGQVVITFPSLEKKGEIPMPKIRRF